MRKQSRKQVLIPVERIARTIVRLRGQNVMRDVDLPALYKVTTKRLNEPVKRNHRRFPREMSIFVVRAFVGFRQMFQSNEELMKKLDKLADSR